MSVKKPLVATVITVFDPGNNDELVAYTLAGAKDAEKAVAAARTAFDEGPWGKMPAKQRVKLLYKFADLIEENADFLGTVESYNVGKILHECIGHDVARASANIRFFASAIEQQQDDAFFSNAKFLGKEITTMSIAKRLPVGVAALISPWNSPIMLATWKIGPCLAAGNTCVIKPSPWALLSVLQLGELANQAGIPKGVLNILPGDADAGKAIVSHAGVDRVSFTGSVPVGKIVAKANAEARLAPVSLELGGKSPTVVFEDADLDFAAKGVARGIFRSQGQSCVAGSRLLLQDSIYDSFMDKLITNIKAMKMGYQVEESTQIGPIINKKHLAHVEACIQKAKDEGAKLTIGGKRPDGTEFKKGNFVEPTVFENVTRSMEIWKEEVFGPVLAVMRFKNQDEAVELANDTIFGLSSSVWTNNFERAMQMTSAIDAGMVWVNAHFVRDLRAPFGGVKESGIGSEGGRYSLEFFTKPKMMCFPYPDQQ